MEVRRREGVSDLDWSRFIRCLGRVHRVVTKQMEPREGDPPDDSDGPDVPAPVVEFVLPAEIMLPGEIDTARKTLMTLAGACTRDPPAIAYFGP